MFLGPRPENPLLNKLGARVVLEGDDLPTVLTKLHNRFSTMPNREEYNGGQRCQYVQQAEVLAWLEDAMKKVGVALPLTEDR